MADVINLPLRRVFAELEVSQVTSSHPTVTIISPTPRAFQFPINVNDPYASPSSSPFEPDLKALSFTPPPPRPLSPTSSINSDSSSLPSPTSTIHLSPQHTRQTQPPALPKRRKSLGGDPVERRPRKGDEDYIKRPENAFILFRRKCCEERSGAEGPEDGQGGSAAPVKKQRQADLSKMISQQWKSLSQEERQRWEDLAKEKKKEHEQMYPNYVYRPQRSKPTKGKKGKGRKALTEGEQDTDPETYSCLLPVSLPSSSSSSSNRQAQGRARSAPTPPLTYQTIHIPTVYMPSCPPSPALRSQRTPLPKLSLDHNAPARMTFIPDENLLMPQPFSQSPYDPHLEVCALVPSSMMSTADLFIQNNEMFQGMFDLPGQNVPLSKNDSLSSLSIPQTDSMLSPNDLVSPVSTFGTMSPTSPEDGPFSPLAGYPHTQSLDGALGFVPQVDGNCYNQFMEYPSYGWGNAEWQNVNEIGSSDEYDLNSIPAVELSVPDYGQLSVPEQTGDFCPPPQQSSGANQSELFTGVFSYNNEHMMWS